MKLTGAQAFWETLVRLDVKYVFGIPGGSTLPIYDALPNYPIHHILARQEQGAVHMANGYAQSSRKVGVALATSGPGATNMVTGIATAMMDSIPIVCFTGQVGSHLVGTDAFQEVDVTGITIPITKHNYIVTRANDLVPAIREAFYIARSGRPGPVLIDITKDAQQEVFEFEWEEKEITLPGYRPEYKTKPEQFNKAIELINKAKQPVILAGHGISMSGASDIVLELAERANIPIAMTLLGIGSVPASHPLNLGMMGMHGEAWVNHAIQNADLLLAFGMRFEDRVTGTPGTYAVNAKKIHIDIDPTEINKIIKADVGIVGDLKVTLEKILPGVDTNRHDEWMARIDEMKGEAAVRDIKNLPDIGHLYVAHVINDIWQFTEGRAVVVSDVGQNQMWEAQYYHHEEENSLITSGGLGTMGFALPTAIGAKFGRPDKEVWVIVGDGGFQMTMNELGTLMQEKIKLVIALMNNGFLGMVRQWQEMFYEKRYSSTPLVNPNFVGLVNSYGLKGIQVTERSQVKQALLDARNHPESVLIDFHVEKEDSVFPMVPAGVALDSMIRRPIVKNNI